MRSMSLRLPATAEGSSSRGLERLSGFMAIRRAVLLDNHQKLAVLTVIEKRVLAAATAATGHPRIVVVWILYIPNNDRPRAVATPNAEYSPPVRALALCGNGRARP